MSTNDELFWQMFMQFLQKQAIVPAPQVPSIKSKCTLNPKVFTGEGFSIEQIHECLKTIKISLNLKITLNLERILKPETYIAYTFSHTSETAQNYIASKIQA